ncbi:MAG TPA: DMT family transporter, partial [Egibacteraceae bacterium]|nr:DMT family transporter [Egibacteraceae bacterium]
CVPALRRLGRDGLIHGGILGVALCAGYAFQTVGLRHIEATVAGFITGMFVVFTPVLSALLLRRRPGPFALMGVFLATGGMALLTLPAQPAGRAAGGFALSFGVMLMLACAVSFAAQIVGLGAWAARHDALPLTVVQLATVAVLHAGLALAREPSAAAADWDAPVLFAVVFTALIASAFGFWMQTTAQKVIPPTRAAVIMTMEPVFAGLAGFLLLSERLGAPGWAGSALILSGMLVAEAAPTRRAAAHPSG